MRSTKRCIVRPVFLLILVMLFCGCQPAPERTPVVYGGDLDEKLAGTPAPTGAYAAPSSWQETLELKGSDIHIEFDATVSVPDATAFPVYKVRPVKFDVTQIKPLANHFTQGKEVTKDAERTKAEFEDDLLLARKENDEEWAAQLEKQIAAAPETVEVEKITDWDPEQSPSGTFLDEDGERVRISAGANTFCFLKGFIATESLLAGADKSKIGDIAIAPGDATAAAQSLLNTLGIDFMTAGSVEKAQCYINMELFSEPQPPPSSQGYSITFVRNIDGIPGIADKGLYFNMSDDFDYKAPLYPESISIYVNEAGDVESFDWRNPLRVEVKISDNVSLLPFEDMQQRIRDMLGYIVSRDEASTKVTHVSLIMAIANVKDHPEEAMYVPAWMIDYTQTSDGMTEERRLALNAVDGGRILEAPIDISPEMLQLMNTGS